MLLSIIAFEDSDIEWNENDPKDNTGAVKISGLPWSKIAFCSNEDKWTQEINSFDVLEFDKNDLPTFTLSESVKSIIKQLFTNEDIKRRYK